MKNNIIKILGLVFLLLVGANTESFSQDKPDENEVRTQYSLFSEYHKNKDYTSALPFGWKVVELDPKTFAKWIYYKMEDAYWYLHDSSEVSQEEALVLADTLVYLYDKAIENYPEDKGYFQVRKAFVKESWLNAPAEEVIAEYEKAIEYNPEVSSYYYHRLGQLYKAQAETNDEYKQKALDLYTGLSEKEPDNAQWPSELESLVDSIDELVDLAKKAWDLDKDNAAKAWKYAALAMKANRYPEAVTVLEFLVQKEPGTVNYWNQLATAYQKTDNTQKSEEAYRKLISLEPDNKNHYLNLGIMLMDKGQLSAARTQFRKASEVGGNWGLPIFYEGLLYEKAARSCTYDFDAKLVYLLAQNTYRRAKGMDGSATQAQQRISELANAVPTQEEYFFRGLKSGQTVPITGGCYSWIGGSVTVP